MLPSLLFPPPLIALVPTPGLARKGAGSYSVPPGSCQRRGEASSPRQLHNVCWAGASMYPEFGVQGSHLSPSRLWETAADSPFVGSQETEHLSPGRPHTQRMPGGRGQQGWALKDTSSPGSSPVTVGLPLATLLPQSYSSLIPRTRLIYSRRRVHLLFLLPFDFFNWWEGAVIVSSIRWVFVLFCFFRYVS